MAGTVKEEAQRLRRNIDAVYEDGKQTEYDAFWNAYQANGERINYQQAFKGDYWTIENFKPKYDIIIGNKANYGNEVFNNSKITADLVEICENLGIVIDLSSGIYFESTFYSSSFKRIGIIDISNAQRTQNMFNYCKAETIDKVIVSETTPYYNTFSNMTNLKNITFEGVIGASISFAQSLNLTSDSVQSIIDGLADLTGGTAQTLDFHSDVVSKLTDEQLAQIANKNWEVA